MPARPKRIETLDDLKLRSYVDPESGCWHWREYRNERGTPTAHFMHPTAGKRCTMTVSLISWVLAHGNKLPIGRRRAFRVCGSVDCANPAHIRALTDAERGRVVAKAGVLKNKPKRIEANRKNARAQSSITEAIARAIRQSELPATQAAVEFGVSLTSVRSIRQRRRWREVEPANSVFDWALRA